MFYRIIICLLFLLPVSCLALDNPALTDNIYENELLPEHMWWLESIEAQRAWEITKGKVKDGDPIIVAVIDEGIDRSHPEFADQLWISSDCTDWENEDIEGGCINGGYDTANDDNDPDIYRGDGIMSRKKVFTYDDINDYNLDKIFYDMGLIHRSDAPITYEQGSAACEISEEGHGTNVSGIIAAKEEDGNVVTGVAPDVKIMHLKACSYIPCTESYILRHVDVNGSTTEEAIYEVEEDSSEAVAKCALTTPGINHAIEFAANNGASIINMSLGSRVLNEKRKKAIEYAQERSVLIIASAGNGDYSTETDEVIDVDIFYEKDGIGNIKTVSETVQKGDDNDVTPAYPASSEAANIVSVAAMCVKEQFMDRGHFYDWSLFVPEQSTAFPYWGMAPYVPFNDCLPKVNNDFSTGSLDAFIKHEWSNDFDQLTRFSNFGADSVDLGAPGSAIIAPYPLNHLAGQVKYRRMSGTSQASPVVAGVAALVMAANPDLSYMEVKDIVMNTGDFTYELFLKTVSSRRVNAFKAVQKVYVPVVEQFRVLNDNAAMNPVEDGVEGSNFVIDILADQVPYDFPQAFLVDVKKDDASIHNFPQEIDYENNKSNYQIPFSLNDKGDYKVLFTTRSQFDIENNTDITPQEIAFTFEGEISESVYDPGLAAPHINSLYLTHPDGFILPEKLEVIATSVDVKVIWTMD